jgi:hypothetical protein
MRAPLLLALPFLMAPTSAWALLGTVISNPTAHLVRSDGTLETLKLKVNSLNLWDGRQVIVLSPGPRSSPESSCACQSQTVGRLDRPLTLHVRIRDRDHLITVPAHRTLLYRKGDEAEASYQFDVKESERGGIAIDPSPSTEGRDEIFASHLKAGELKSILIQLLAVRVSRKDFVGARKAYAEIVAHEVYSSEIQQIQNRLKSLPEAERPINTLTGDVRPEIRELRRAFPTADFDQMTRSEFVSFFRAWALRPGLTHASDQATGDETYLFRVMDAAGLNQGEQVALLELTLDSRIDGFLKLAASGRPTRDASFRDLYAAEMVKTWLESMRTSESEAYISRLRKRIRAMDEPVRAWLREALLDDSL